MKDSFKVCIIGLGYIGLPTAAVIANKNIKVIGVDINKRVVNKIKQGKIHIVEKGLEEIVSENVKSKNLIAQLEPSEANVFIIAVPTPLQKDNESVPLPDISYVKQAINDIAKYLRSDDLVIIESTCPVGTTNQMQKLISKLTGFAYENINLAYCPERVLPGNIIYELENNDRLVGGVNEKSTSRAKTFYEIFCKGNITKTKASLAELVKLTENSYRDVNIAFANEMSIICEKYNINVYELISLANMHPRVNVLRPGCGVGGHCIAIDPLFIVSGAPESTELIQAARRVNDNKSKWVTKQILLEVFKLKNELNRTPVVGCFGLTFKPNVDDTRESPALLIIQELISKGLKVFVCEPNLDSYSKLILKSADNVVAESDILVFLVSHQSFEKINTQDKLVLDYCGLFS